MNHDKAITILLIIVSILLIFNLYISINHIVSYDEQRQTGNNKWHEVETILKDYDNRIRDIEKQLCKGE